MKIIMRQNLLWRVKLYQNEEILNLFTKIIDEYVAFAKSRNFKPVLIFLPQKDDVNFIKNNFHFYESFLKKLMIMEDLILLMF